MSKRGVSALTLALAAGCTQSPRVCEPTTLIVRTQEVIHSDADARRLVRDARAAHVGTLSILVKRDEDEEGLPSGRAFYASAMLPRDEGYESFDALRAVLDAAHAEGLRVLAWVPQFHDATAAQMLPDASMQTG